MRIANTTIFNLDGNITRATLSTRRRAKSRFLLSVLVALALEALWAKSTRASTYNAYNEFDSVQGGTSGVWRYQEFDGVGTFADLIYYPAGTGATTPSGLPTWASAAYAMPVIFKDSATSDGLVLHPGIPGFDQPTRHDIVLRWVSPASGIYDVSGFIRGDSRAGIGGNGVDFTVYDQALSALLTIPINGDDKSSHPFSIAGMSLSGGDSGTRSIIIRQLRTCG